MDTGYAAQLADHRHYVTDAWPPGALVRTSRAKFLDAPLTPPQVLALEELDAILIEAVREHEVLEDDPAQPLVQWWWHLGAIQAGTFPLALLPPALRAVVTEPPPTLPLIDTPQTA